MGLRDRFKTSDKLETSGISLELGETRLLLARAGGKNQKFNAAMARISKNHKRAIDHDLLSQDKARQLVFETYADHVILNWETLVDGEWREGIEGPDGDLLPFNRENVIETLNEMPDLFTEIKLTAENIQYYRQSLLDDAVKN